MPSTMLSLRKLLPILFKPKKSDSRPLARLYHADEELNRIATELGSFDGRSNPERCALVVNALRACQDKVLSYIHMIMDEAIPTEWANRDFRGKFPEEVLQENLAGQLWFGAECLAAGSVLMNKESESRLLKPEAQKVIRALDTLRRLLKDQAMKTPSFYPDKVKVALRVFDEIFAAFEYNYVSTMVTIKTPRQYETQQDIIILFCETTSRALDNGLLTQDMVDNYDPALMFTIPRLAIICGLVVFTDGPLSSEKNSDNMCRMFKPFSNLLNEIRWLLTSLSKDELMILERSLCSSDESDLYSQLRPDSQTLQTLLSIANSTDSHLEQRESPCSNNTANKGAIHTHTDIHTENCSNSPDTGASNTTGTTMNLSGLLGNRQITVAEVHCPSSTGGSQGELKLFSDTDIPSHNDYKDSSDLKNHLESTAVVDQTIASGNCEHIDDVSSELRTNQPQSNNSGSETTDNLSSTCPPSPSSSPLNDCESGSESSNSESSATSLSDYHDPEVIMAIEAMQLATRTLIRSQFSSTRELLHRLFVCVSGVADQLQTYSASDLRSTLKAVFEMMATDSDETQHTTDSIANRWLTVDMCNNSSTHTLQEDPPSWVADEESIYCTLCSSPFTLMRRRHHCRSCGQIFCSRCSSNSVPLPQYGNVKPVRVCTRCFLFRVNPFPYTATDETELF